VYVVCWDGVVIGLVLWFCVVGSRLFGGWVGGVFGYWGFLVVGWLIGVVGEEGLFLC